MQNYTACVLSKQTKQKTTCELIQRSPNETFHADICGLFKNLTNGGNKYLLTMTLACQRYNRAQLLKHRGNIDECPHNYIQWIERLTGVNMERVHIGNDPEFLWMRGGLERKGITLKTLSEYTTQSNSLTEGMNRTLLEKARSIPEYSGMDWRFCAEAIIHAADLQKRAAKPEWSMKNPMQTLLGTVLNNSQLRIFGCTSYMHIH